MFIFNGLKCPVPPRTEPRRVDDKVGDFYPAAARRAGAEGATTVRVLIAAPSNVLGCTVIRSSGNKDLDDASCSLVRQRPDIVSKRGRTAGFAAGVRQVDQQIQWKLEGAK
jgi:protein TonB